MAVDLGVEEHRQEVVRPLLDPLVDGLLEHGVDALPDLGRVLDPLLVRAHGRADDPVLEPDELLGPVDRQPEELEEHGRRQRLGHRGVDVAAAVARHGVDQVAHEGPRPLLEQGDLAGGEDRVEQLPVVAVVRRVDLEGDQRPHLPDRDRVDARAEDLRVPEHVPDVLVAPDEHHPGPLAQLDDGPGVAQQLEQRLGMGERLRVGLAAPHGQIGHRTPPENVTPVSDTSEPGVVSAQGRVPA